MMDERVVDDAPSETGGAPVVGRRGLVGGLVLGGVAVGAGVAGGVASRASAASVYRSRSLTVEVACLGALWREGSRSNPADDGDFRAPFLVEGWIYPEGTIKGDGFIPVEDGAIGRWFCRGYALSDSQRGEPHVCSHQDFFFGAITPGRLFPPDLISSAGIEGTLDRTQVSTRAIIGGTGEYLGATGQVFQQFFATNTSYFPGTTDEGFCFRFDFDLRVLD